MPPKAPTAPPPAPLPDLNRIWQFNKIRESETLTSDTEREFFDDSPVGQHLKHCEQSCQQLKEKLQVSWNVFRDSREQAKQDGSIHNKTVLQKARQKVEHDAFMYNFCQLNTMCPNPTRLYVGCWKSAVELLGPERMWHMTQNRSINRVCRPEREILQRCVGRLVSTSVDTLPLPQEEESISMGGATTSISSIHEEEQWEI